MKFLIVLLLLALSGCVSNYVEIDNGSDKIKIFTEIADEPEEWTKGLMFREYLGEKEGMLFIFNDNKERIFWMKNTLIPLDIIFISDSLEIVNIAEADPCGADPCALYNSEMPAKYVLEVNKGFSKRNNLQVGNSLEIFN